MRTLLMAAFAAGIFAATPQAFALRIAMPNYQTSQKAAMAEAVVVGKVTSIEAERVELEAYPGAKEKLSFQVAVIKIETSLSGAKNITHIKVAFAPTAPGAPEVPMGRPIRPGAGPVPLAVDQEGIFFLMPHSGGSSMMTIPMGFDPIPANAANYKEELAKITTVGTMLADPLKAMQAKALPERQTALAALTLKYATPPMNGGAVEQVPLPKELSQAILATILEIDWTPVKNPEPGYDYSATGPQLASRWGLSPGANGIPKVVVKPGENYQTRWKQALDTWAKADGEKPVLKKYVPKQQPQK